MSATPTNQGAQTNADAAPSSIEATRRGGGFSRKEPPDQIDPAPIGETRLSSVQLAETLAWQEAKLTAATVVFFFVQLLITGAYIVATYFLKTQLFVF